MVSIAGPVQPDTSAHVPDSSAQLNYLALGDSYTIGQSVAVSDRYPEQASGLLRGEGLHVQDPEIIAVTGWTTQDLLNGLKSKMTASPNAVYSMVTLLIGVNNQYQGRSLDEYKTQFTQLLQESIQLAGNRVQHVVVLSVPDYSVTPFASTLNKAVVASQVDLFNVANKAISLQYGVQYLDVTTASREAANDPTLIAGDGLHFSGKEYRVWSSMLAPLLKQAVQ
ncbi:MAG TPA: GDSL-type esterase/lipase family protein [Chitinophagaceae bacterium]